MYQHVKRLIDIVLSLGAIVVLSPVLLVLAVLIKLDSKGPVAHLLHGGAVQSLFKLRQFRFFGGNLAGNAADLV